MIKKAGLFTAIFQGDMCIFIVCEVSKIGAFHIPERMGTHCHKTLAFPMDTVYLYKGQCNAGSSKETVQGRNLEVLE